MVFYFGIPKSLRFSECAAEDLFQFLCICCHLGIIRFSSRISCTLTQSLCCLNHLCVREFTVRFRASGHLHIVGRHGGRKLKKLWQELGVAPWRRDTTPLLFYGETPIAAADDLFVTTEGEVKDGEGVRLMWRKTGD